MTTNIDKLSVDKSHYLQRILINFDTSFAIIFNNKFNECLELRENDIACYKMYLSHSKNPIIKNPIKSKNVFIEALVFIIVIYNLPQH